MDEVEGLRSLYGLIDMLRNRLKECAIQNAAYQGVLMNFPDAREQLQTMVDAYRQAQPIREKVEMGFQELDSLIRLISETLDLKEVCKLLEQRPPNDLIH